MTSIGKICGRASEIEKLRTALTSSPDRLELIGISGYGGVGKTFLLNHVMQQVAPEKEGRLVLWVDGAAKGSTEDFMRILSQMMAPQHLRGLENAAKKDFFPQVRKLEKAYAAECQALMGSVEKHASGPNFERIKEAILILIKIGTAFNGGQDSERSRKKGSDVLRDMHLEDCTARAFELIQPFVQDSSSWPGILQDLLGVTYARKVRTQLFDVASEALIGDLSAVLSGYQLKDILKPTQQKIKDFDRLLLVVDDFEIIGRTLGPFLLGHLLPALRSAKFPAQVVILCRDALADTDPGFEQHLTANTGLQLRLEPFAAEEGVAYLMSAGYTEEKAQGINEQCRGLPFLLTSFAEGRNQDALFYQRFFERTTRWMTNEQKDWFIPLCYLDEVNRDTVSTMITDANAEVVVEWFRHEASIRALGTQHFVVNPLIREMILQHHRNILGRKSQEDWIAKGKAAATI